MGQEVSEPELLDPYPTDTPWNRMSDLELEAGWLTSAASQVFLMQLGFLAFEVGFVEQIWINSIIIKNIEDTIVGTITYVLFTHTMAASKTVWGGVIGSFDQIFLFNTSKSEHEGIFISAMYAVTCATIISGAVLERMKNSAYVAFTFYVMLINYSIAACWAWNPNSWLGKLGFVDCAGSFVVHGVGGITSLVGCYFLGARRGAYIESSKDEEDENGKKVKRKLKEVEPARNPTMLAFGGFILWYGWFAFNITSPIIGGVDAGQNLGQSGLNTLLAPCAAAASCIMYKGIRIKKDANSFKKIVTMEDLLGTILAGAVAITASCYTAPWWASLVIGFFASFVFFFGGWVVREKLVIDDPLGVCSVHLFPGFYGVLMQGLFADGSVGDPGLFFGGYKHFGVQVLGCVVGFVSQLCITIFVWKILLEKFFMVCIIRTKDEEDPIRVDTLDTYLGVGFFDIDPESAFKDMIKCDNRFAKRFLLSFRVLCNNSGQGNELDFLVCVHNLRVRYRGNDKMVNDNIQGIMDKIYALYIDDNGNRRINITPQEKSLIEQSKRNKNITVFDNVYKMKFDELKAQLSAFLKNLKDPNEYKELLKKRERPYTLQDDWSILWITDEYDDDENGRGRAPTVDVPLISSKKKEAARIDVKALEEQLSNDEEEKEEKKEEEEGDGDIAEPAGSTQVTSIPSSSGAYNDTPAGDVEMTSTPAGITKTGGSVDVENIINEDKPAGNAGQGVTVVDFSAFDDD